MSLFDYKLPDIGEGIHEGEIVKWLIKTGDWVTEDQVIAEVQNDKAIVEIPSPVNGKVLEVKVPAGSRVVVGDTLIVFDVEGAAEAAVPAGVVREDSSKAAAAPSVRKLAREKGIPLAEIRGTGKGNRITMEDVLRFAAGQVPLSQNVQPTEVNDNGHQRIPIKGIRRAIADAVVKSLYTSPQVTIMDEVEVTKLVELREKAKPYAEKRNVKLTYLPFFIKSVVAACREFPIMNAFLDENTNEIVIRKNYHIGVAMDTEQGLLVPVVKDAERKNIWSIAEELRELTERGRQGKLLPHELKGSTITITNIGSAGGMFFTPILNYPESAILGMGRITHKPWVRGDEIVVAPVISLSLSFDHRIIDGAMAQNFMNSMKSKLEQSDLLLLEI